PELAPRPRPRACPRSRPRALHRCVIGVLSTENPDNATVEPPNDPKRPPNDPQTTLERPPRASPRVGGLVSECAGPASDQAQLPGGAHGRGPVAHAELLVDMDQVGLHGGL